MGRHSQAADGRHCAACGRPLSRYNGGDYCGSCSTPAAADPAARDDRDVAVAVAADIGARLRALRRRRGMSLDVLAGLSGKSAAYLSMIENGKRPLDRYSLIVCLADALGVPPADLLPGAPASSPAAADPPAGPRVSARTGDRRVVQALDAVGGEQLDGAADNLAALVDHYSHAICAVPPAAIYDELLAVRSHADAMISRAGRAPRRADLVTAACWLSNLLAVAACDMGEHATARVWCTDSQRRSQEAGNPEPAAWALLTRSMIAYYQGQSRQSLTLATRGRVTVPLGSVVHAKLAAQEMRAAALAGDAARMTEARTHAAKAMARLPAARPSGVFSIAAGEDPPYTATSLMLVGDFGEAVAATNRVIQAAYRLEARQRGANPSGYARSLLILGLAQAGNRRLDDAVAAGHEALSGSRQAWPTLVLAGQLDRVLAQDFAGSRQAQDYHTRYLEAASTPAARPRQAQGDG